MRELADDSLLAFEEVRPVTNSKAVEEFVIESGRAVVPFRIENVQPIAAAAALSQCAGSESLAPGKVGNRRDAVPVMNSERDKRGVVVPIAECCFQANLRRLIAQHSLAEDPRIRSVQIRPQVGHACDLKASKLL